MEQFFFDALFKIKKRVNFFFDNFKTRFNIHVV